MEPALKATINHRMERRLITDRAHDSDTRLEHNLFYCSRQEVYMAMLDVWLTEEQAAIQQQLDNTGAGCSCGNNL